MSLLFYSFKIMTLELPERRPGCSFAVGALVKN